MAAFFISLVFAFAQHPALAQIESVQNQQTQELQGRTGVQRQSGQEEQSQDRGGRGPRQSGGGDPQQGGENGPQRGPGRENQENIGDQQEREQERLLQVEDNLLKAQKADEASVKALMEAMALEENLIAENQLRRNALVSAGLLNPRTSLKGAAKFTLPQAPILLKVEPSLLIVKPGGDFSSKVVMANFSGQELDEVRFTLLFDPALLQVGSTDVANEEDEAVAGVQVQCDNQAGRLEFLQRYAAPQNSSDWLMTVHWLPRQEAGATKIEFERLPETTSLRLAGRELTSFGPAASNWLLSSIVRLAGEQGQTKSRVIGDLGRAITETLTQPASGAPAQVLLSPKSAPPEPGKIWTIDLLLDNPSSARISSIELELLFDSQKLAVIDYDRDNNIRRGVNLWDGFSHSNFPFDRHLANRVDRAGRLIYHMGFGNPRTCPSGHFARLHLAVLQPVVASDLQIGHCLVK